MLTMRKTGAYRLLPLRSKQRWGYFVKATLCSWKPASPYEVRALLTTLLR